jgi:integrase
MTATTFKSPLAKDMRAYLELRRALGTKAVGMEEALRRLDAFIVREYPQTEDLSPTILAAWLADRTLAPSTRAGRMGTIRQFCLFRRRTVPSAYVPDRQKDRTLWPVRVPRFRPYIFTDDEVKKLLQAALGVPSRGTVPPRAQTFFTLLLLLYATGLRLSEAVGLRVGDIDWVEGTLLIRDTKFFKTRLVPVAPDVLAKLRRYQSLLRLPRGRASLTLPLFQKEPGHGYCATTISQAGMKLLRTAGLKSRTGRLGPRLHDLRHTFAVKCVARWYTEGRDVQNLLPQLATYMGHTNLLSTQYYLNITVDILHMAGDRFERACAPKGRA